ncbi:MAG: hypothetical protein E6J90_13300 [Deltaproteobacteria bacterium]|nr:MAG: hypothetical protein E6J91_39245 [Deltaproteobacteria bacterium]TMQ21942.1 MAG: hypothetical protein E6J90_13300 [Deltaproteobacteria bacterium]
MTHPCLLATFAAGSLAACYPGPSDGIDHNTAFSWDPCLLDCALSERAMAAGGARASISVTLKGASVGPIASVSSSNPQIASFTWTNSDPQNVRAVSGRSGVTDLILLDSSGVEIDRAAVTVKATTLLALDGDLATGAGGTSTILAGSKQLLHTTTKNGGETLVGVGAVKFTPSGRIMTEPAIIFDDSYMFSADPGVGSVTADCVDAHVVVPIAAVSSTAITGVMLNLPSLTFAHTEPGKAVDVTVFAGTSTPIYSAGCTWTTMPLTGLNISYRSGGYIGATHAATWLFSGVAGSYTAKCTVAGGKSAMLAVTVN